MAVSAQVTLGLVVVVFGLHNVCTVGVVHLYVSPTGSDTHDGKSEATAFKSIHKAVSLLHRSAYKGVEVFIELTQGYHDLASTLHINKPLTSQLTIRSLHGSEVHVTGGKQVASSHFKTVTDHNILSRLPATARHHVKVLHLPDIGIKSYPELTSYGFYIDRTAPIEVFYNGAPLRLASWPNETLMRQLLQELSHQGLHYLQDFINIANVLDGKTGKRFQYNTSINRPLSWQHENDVWTYGYWYWSWADRAVKVQSIDAHTHDVTLVQNPQFGLRTGHWKRPGYDVGYRDQGGYFRFLNVLAELDQPGEYYLDRSSGNLYVWMPNGDGRVKSTDVVYLSLITDCFDLQSGTANVVIRDFTIEACRKRGVHANSVSNIQILDMEIRNTGGYSIAMTGHNNHCFVSRCMLHDGDGGVFMSGGTQSTLKPSDNVIEDNEISNYARVAAVGHHAVSVNGVAHNVRYNHIYGGQYTAILYSGNDNVMEYNHIHHVCVNASDCGALHTGRDWTSRGNLIRHNIVHHNLRLVPGADVRGVMLDDQASGSIITNNVFFKNDVHVNIGGGRDNVVSNNVMYDADTSTMQVDGRGSSHNNDGTLFKRLHAVPYNSSLWTSRYPQLANFESKSPGEPRGNQISKNLVYLRPHHVFIRGYSGRLQKDSFFNVTDVGYANAASDFVNVDHGDFRVQCLAADWARRVGFPQPPTLKDVGPRYGVGPQYKRKARQTVTLSKPSGVCTTNAPSTSVPMPAYLPDGARINDLVKVPKHGCYLSMTKCTDHPSSTSLYEDAWGEANQHTGDNETACLARAAQQWKYCGSHDSDEATAVYGPTGAMTIAGEGCFFAMYGCPLHGGPADGHVVHGHFIRDGYAERHDHADHNESACLSRALSQWVYCGSNPNHPVTSLYRPTGAVRTAGTGCWIHFQKCPKHLELKTMFYDDWGATNKGTDNIQTACFSRAQDFWEFCGSNPAFPVTAFFRPHAASVTYP